MDLEISQKSYKVTKASFRENYMKELKGVMEGNSVPRLISSTSSLYFHYSIYVFNTEGIRGSPDIKQSLAYAAQLISAHIPFSTLQHRRDAGTHVHWYSSRRQLML